MSFRAVITEEYTLFNGSDLEKLTGLACYIDALRRSNISDELIKESIKIAFKEDDEDTNQKVETLLDNDKVKIQKFDLNGLSKDEVKELLDKEIFNKLF